MPRLFSLLMLLCLAFNAHADSYISRTLNKPVPGGVAVVELGPSAAAPKATYQGKPVLVIKEQDSWLAIVGIPLTVKPGNERISSGGRSLPFIVGYKKYPEQRITLKNKSQVNPAPAQLKRIEAELAVQIKAYRSFSPNLPSNLILDKPVNGPLSSKFGVRRFFNGEERNPHSGLDFAVPAGTPIKTPANGKVILVGNYFFNGNTVFVDHGQGFISMFCHMSAVDVKVGQQLVRGAVVGKVGSTGRATGPHMHWNVSLNDARVDPAIFIGAFQP
ncbi:M23 family metallopeptidase [Pseudomonas lurida]|jgi:murein DD-endopeptidase MepM/ murein hydrolase activator NlpD|uniref:Peptidoglycan DD-metalloendopeptidase family protein n=1 Tax=Pseudomonas quebecensis TaxID=2995174 RepID=A0ABY6QHP5_9PSED|nr:MULTISPECIES: peptidoglycan DD-metalloendopeptidase family protein [Pseudomonas]MBA1293708.1 M23 family metallopeptidase [Pseudomonas lurida]MCP1512680.1 murein DD-endopeptidase MepM/ murein hydrolase activator NlpD [Pseudomonas rhodesiae]MCX4064665.1 peptidoglycan DD-metalloendopeptidase family protein [Pseudomonas quebecensis]MDF9771530.1 murein DD-endopeptidase MepM/ murein hydrolase activator NlpD [Pseudomonas rhodesiae]UZW19482.1 peptidoglycan DD-metalloendopeptidase family protein [Ps